MQKVLVALMLGLGLAAQAAEAPPKILACMRANVPQSVRVQDIELTTTDRSGSTRELKGRLYAQRESAAESADGLVRVALRIRAPSSLAGAAYLVREASKLSEQGMYVYLPAVRRVRRVSGEFADGSLMGTDFSYNDFRLLQNAFGDQRPTLEASEKIDGRDSQVMGFKPNKQMPSGYSLVRAWIDQKTCVPLKVEFYQDQTLRKRLLVPAAGLVQSGSHWYASIFQMSDLTAGSQSELKVLKIVSDEKLPKRVFDPDLFYLGG